MITICETIWGIICPPVAVFMKRGCGKDFWINLVLTLLLYVGGWIHCFRLNGLTCCESVLIIIFPPGAIAIRQKKLTMDFLLNCIFVCLLYLPAPYHAYYIVANSPSCAKPPVVV